MAKIVVDGNTAAARVAYSVSQLMPIYPITPSSPMAEYCSRAEAEGKLNIFGTLPHTLEMQSEAGAAGALHGALMGGALATSFTSSQGLLLMIPNLYKMAGECLPAVIHVAARAVASHALSIFGDHSDVMSVRMCGFNMLCSSNVQEAQDMAMCAHMLAHRASLPVLHFFDGFRTSHEYQKIDALSKEDIASLFPLKTLPEAKLNSSAPLMFGTAQNPDVFFQNRLAREKKYTEFLTICDKVFADFEKLTHRKYRKFDYFGSKNAKNIVVLMGSASETMIENAPKDGGVVKVRLFRPFDTPAFLKALPKSTEKVIVLDRTVESGSREPLFLDVKNALSGSNIAVAGGVYGLGGKEFSPVEAHAVWKNFESMKDDFSVGVNDDIQKSSLPLENFVPSLSEKEIKIFGLGSDGSVSASKTITKLLGRKDDTFVQGYFEYDSKKAGSLTISHLRVSKKPILSAYLCHQPDIVMINNFSFVHRYHCLEGLKDGGVVIFNTIFEPDELTKVLPNEYKKILLEKKAKVFVIDGHKIANENGLKEKINMIMTSALFSCTGLVKNFEPLLIEDITKTFAEKGKEVVEKNISAVKAAENMIKRVNLKQIFVSTEQIKPRFAEDFNKRPISQFSCDGSIQTDTSKFEKRAIAASISEWQKDKCIQCGQCVLACPHGALKAVLVKRKPKDVPFVKAYGVDGYYRIQISPEDCTGCGLCQEICPALGKAIIMRDASKILEQEKKNYQLVKDLKTIKKTPFSKNLVKGLQFEKNYFEFPGACAGCGQTPYIKLATMLFGDRMVIANATGCSSIYSGSYPSCPYSKNEKGQGPAWANSLFEDNAEFGYGIKMAKALHNSNESVWIIGGDGWAYDIGFAGLDHVLSSGANVNILVLDNENYANTGGQASKATPAGACVQLANSGKETNKKNLGLMAMTYKNVYVAQVALGADMNQCIKAFREAESFNGPSLIIAYSTCVNQGFDMSKSLTEMKKAVDAGYWMLYRYHPTLGFTLDRGEVNNKFLPFLLGERRFALLNEKDGAKAKRLFKKAKDRAKDNFISLKRLERTNPKK